MNYQVCDPLTEEEYEALKASIAKTGVEVPVVIDEHGDILDGHHRMRAYYELKAAGVDVPPPAKDIRRGLTEDEKRNLARTLNAVRRQMSKDQRNKLIVAMREDGMSYRQIGEAVGVDAKTAHNVVTRSTVENSTVELPATITGRDGKERPATMPRPEPQAAEPDASPPLPRYTNGMPVLNMPRSRERERPLVAAEPPRPHVAHNSGNNEWYTPAEYVGAARAVMGHIDLDPASSELANTVVQAARYYTIDDSGLDHNWTGNVWMNPPYSGDLVGKFIDKLEAHVINRHIKQATVLVNNATETAWFQTLLGIADAVCFLRSRISYWSPGGPKRQPLQGQAVIYIGPNTDAFAAQFTGLGFVVKPWS